MTSLQEAVKTGNLEALRSVPKSDLHNHAFGGGNRAWVARVTGCDVAPLDRPLNSIAEMHAWVDRHLGALFVGPAGRLNAFEATFVQAQFDGVTRLEIGEDVGQLLCSTGAPSRSRRSLQRFIHALRRTLN